MTRLFIALPLINENELLPEFIKCISQQSFTDFTLFICVNQPDEWWDDPQKQPTCLENQKTLESLYNMDDIHPVIIDKCSRGKGWRGKKHGVGWARKTLMDAINKVADKNDIIISVDADTTFGKNYFRSITDNFLKNPDAVGLSVPYFHLPVENKAASRAILRYEIYMRYYTLNLWRIGSPYSFTALGSAIACLVWAYRAIGGMTPRMSGEDFYFLQKLRKYGRLLFYNQEKVYPKARFSDRVYFGTGPAMIKGNAGDWSSYPIFHYRFFNEIFDTYELFPAFYRHTIETRMVQFLVKQFREEDPFEPIRQNSGSEKQFIRACHEKVDGLRILQYLKKRHDEVPLNDESNLKEFLFQFYPEETRSLKTNLERLSFMKSDLSDLEEIRLFLFRKEEGFQVNSSLL